MHVLIIYSIDYRENSTMLLDFLIQIMVDKLRVNSKSLFLDIYLMRLGHVNGDCS